MSRRADSSAVVARAASSFAVDEVPLERRHDDHVDDPERARDDERSARQPGADAARRRHRVPEAVADAAHGVDQLGLARVALELLAQMADVDVDRARLAVLGAAPERLEQHLARVDAPGMRREERSSSNSTYVSCTARPPTSTTRRARSIGSPSATISSSPRGSCRGAGRAAQQRPHAAAELADRERLRDVVVRAELEPEHLVELVVAGGQHDDRHRALRAQALADLEAVEPRQHDVEHDEVDVLPGEAASASSPSRAGTTR